MAQTAVTALIVVRFAALVFVSKQIGEWLSKARMPLITGFLLTGVLAGPYVFGFLTEANLTHLQWLDQISLAVIAFVAGNELHFLVLRARFKSISYVMTGQTLAVFGLGSAGVYFLSGWIPFMQSWSASGRLGVAMLMSAILLARSPSSAIAIVQELRAKGPFTQTALGVTMLTDVVVIVLFTVCFSISKTLLAGKAFDQMALVVLGGELVLALFISWCIKHVLTLLYRLALPEWIQLSGMLAIGYGVFALSGFTHHWSQHHLPFTLHLEPLLICMLAGCWMANRSRAAKPFSKSLHAVAPIFVLIFFTLTGASLGLQTVLKVWPIALAIVLIRFVTMYIGSWLGGTLAGEPAQHNRLSWMVHLTQAGVGLGLAKEVSHAFPSWGQHFAALIIAIIVFNQMIGPIFFKWVLQRIGEVGQSSKEEAAEH